jgi:hypothetical protein
MKDKSNKLIGNQFWKLRSKHGRDRLFATPDLLWDAACEYFDWCENNPIMETDFRGKDAYEVQIPKKRPFTLHGLCIYLDCHTTYFNDFENSIKGKDDEISLGFSKVIRTIKEVIYNQKFTGAAIGIFNANIIARDLGLKDSSDITTQGEKIPGAVVIDWSNATENKTNTETT